MKKFFKKRNISRIDNIFSKHKAPIWFQIISICLLLIGFSIDHQIFAYGINNFSIVFIICACVYFFLFNMGYRSLLHWTKHCLIYNLLSILIVLCFCIYITMFMSVISRNLKLVFIVFVVLYIVFLGIATFLGYRTYLIINIYINYRETEFDLTQFGMLVDGKPCELKLTLAPGHLIFSLNNQRRKFSVDKIKDLDYLCANVWGRKGTIKFSVDKYQVECTFSKMFEDVIFYALAYNIIRVNKRSWIFAKNNNAEPAPQK